MWISIMTRLRTVYSYKKWKKKKDDHHGVRCGGVREGRKRIREKRTCFMEKSEAAIFVFTLNAENFKLPCL